MRGKSYPITPTAHKKAFPMRHTGPDCAYCRSSVAPAKPGKPFICKLHLPMKAKTCERFDDSRKPSSEAIMPWVDP